MATTSTKVLGTVTSVVGEVKATASDGTVRILQVGDKVFSDEVISTSPTGDVKIALEGAGGRTLECGNDANVALNEGLLGIGTAIASQSPVVPPSVAAQQEMAAPAGKPPAGPADVAALQAAIAAGADPSQVAEATAAGGAPGAGGGDSGGGHQPVIIEQGNTSGVVTAGFSTEGGSIQFPTPEFELTAVEEEEATPVVPVVSVSVQVQVQVDVENPDDPQSPTGGVTVSGNAASLIEGTNGEGGGKLVNFIISLDRAFDVDVQVTYTIVPVTASTPDDFFDGPLTQTVTIPAGETQIIVPVMIVQDHLVEADETFNIVLTDAVNATINPAANTAVVTIVDDDALPVANADTNWAQEDVVNASGNVLQNQAHPGDPSDSLDFTDVADTDDEPLTVNAVNGSAANVGAGVAGTYGTLVLNADGSYTYTLNNEHADVQALDDGETLTDAFSYSVTDGFNAPDSAALTITIFGTNDAPIATANVNTIAEDSVSVSGNMITDDDTFGVDSDTDANAVLTVSGVTGGNAHGTLSFDADGGYTYTLDNSDEAVQALGVGQSLTEVYTYTLSDGAGGTDTATLTITITGTNDAPIATANLNTIAEDSVSVSGNMITDDDTFGVDSDTDANAVLSVSGVTGGDAHGTLGFNADGSYTYTLNNADAAVQALGVDQQLTEVYTYTLSDGAGGTDTATLTITITGTNDEPTITVTNGAEGTVFEPALPFGSDPDSTDEVTPDGTFQVADADGLDDITHVRINTTTIAIEDLEGSEVNGAHGTLFITDYDPETGIATFHYELTEATTKGVDDTDLFNLRVSDNGGTSFAGPATITIDIVNDVPSLAVSNVVIPNIAATYEGEYVFEVGADQQSFSASFAENSLVWNNMPTEGGFEFNLLSSSPTQQVYEATFPDPEVEGDTIQFFTITINDDGTYEFDLITPKPVSTEESGNILNSVSDAESGPQPSFTFDPDLFGGFFSVVVTGHDDNPTNADTVTVSSTDLGVNGNTVQPSQGQFLSFEVVPVDNFENVALSSLTVTVASTAGAKAGQDVDLRVFYADDVGNSDTFAGELVAEGDHFIVVFDSLDTARTVDHMELQPLDQNMKITGVSFGFEVTTFPEDFDLNFSLTGTDADNDSAQANFAVSVKTSESGDFEITGTAGGDHLYGSTGDDILTGLGGNDILTGGGGSDTFVFNTVDDGEDTVTDFSVAEGDKLDITDVLSQTDSSHIILVVEDGNTTVMVNTAGTGNPADSGTYTPLVTLQGVTGATLEELLTQINP